MYMYVCIDLPIATESLCKVTQFCVLFNYNGYIKENANAKMHFCTYTYRNANL